MSGPYPCRFLLHQQEKTIERTGTSHLALEAGPGFRLKFGGNKKPLASNNLRYKEFLYWIVYRAERI